MTYIVMTSSAQMPSSVKSQYRNVAIVELDGTIEGTPKMISNRARGVKRVYRNYGPHYVGKTDRCAYRRMLADAEALVKELNK